MNMHARFSPSAAMELAPVDYVAGLSFDEYICRLNERHPRLFEMLDPACADQADVAAEVLRLNELSWEFEGQAAGGRGEHYNRAQLNIGNRRIGMTRLLALFGPGEGQMAGPETTVLDVLAGDGTLRRFAERLGERRPEIISADMSRLMVEACLARGYPCIRQSATKSFLADDALDGVLIAYGSHHLTAGERQAAAAEAHRTLKPGGRFVLHDFATGGGVDRWFRMVVDRYSATGHPHPHFSAREMESLLERAGFRDVSVFEMEDPFTLEGATPAEARANVLRHVHTMYGLVKLPIEGEPALAGLEALTRRTLGELRIEAVDGGYEATLMRQALVAVGVK